MLFKRSSPCMRLLFVGCRREGCRRIFDDAFLAMVKARDQGGASRSGGNEGDNDTHVQFLTKKKPPRGARPLLFQTPIANPSRVGEQGYQPSPCEGINLRGYIVRISS